MKPRVLVMALIAGATACSVVEPDNNLNQENTAEINDGIKSIFEAKPFLDGDAIDTKVTIVPNDDNYSGYTFYWSSLDTVGIYPNNSSQIYFKMTSGAGATSAHFDGGAWDCKANSVYRSYYPFIGNTYLDPASIPVSFGGQRQAGNDNSNHFKLYDYMFTPATSCVNGRIGFSYNHLICGILVWAEVPAGHYTDLMLSVDEPLFVVDGTYDLTAETPAIVGTKYANSLHVDLEITLDNTDILKVYVLNAPIDLSGKTVTISITNDEGFVFYYTYSPSKAFKAGNIYRMRAPGSLESFVSQNITFADANIKAKLVTAFDTNGDGELSFGEAAAATSIEGVFDDETEFSSFDEFQHFIGVETIPDYMFLDWTLQSIKLPPSLTEIGKYAFSRCCNLESITIPGSVKSIGNYAFYVNTGSSQLSTVVIQDGVKSIGGSCFAGCENLQFVDIPESVKSIGSYAFSGCHNLLSIEIPKGVTEIGECTFRDCYQLQSVVIPETVTNIANYAFQVCRSLESLVLPKNLVSIGSYAFEYCRSLLSITIPENVEVLGYNAFGNCNRVASIIVLPETPPSGGVGVFSNCGTSYAMSGCPIYVPEKAFETYRSYVSWESVGSLPKAVDLGLSVKWANWNLGANAPEELGDYYAWGETLPYYEKYNAQTATYLSGWRNEKYAGYDWASYSWCNGTSNTLTKYNEEDGKTEFRDYGYADDVSRLMFGSDWRTPTDAEWTELRTQCTWTWTTYNSVNGIIITGPNGNRIFLPAAGYRNNTELENVGSRGAYGSSTRKNDVPSQAWYFSFSSDGINRDQGERCLGLTIRPVTD